MVTHDRGRIHVETASERRRRYALIVLPKSVSVENLSLSLEFVNGIRHRGLAFFLFPDALRAVKDAAG